MKSIIKKGIVQRSVLSQAVWTRLGKPSSSLWQYNFDGIDDYATLPAYNSQNLEAEFKFTSLETVTGTALWLGSFTARLGMGVTSDGFFVLYANKTFYKTTTPYVLGAEYLVKIKYDGINATLFINDILSITRTITQPYAPTDIYVGKKAGENINDFLGMVITDLELTDLDGNLADRKYPFDDGSGTTTVREVLTPGGVFNGTSFNFNDERWDSV